MHGRYKRAWVAATLLCTLLVPAVGSVAADREDLNELADELEEIRDRIDLHEDQASNLKEKVETVSADISDLEIAINALNDEIEEVQAKANVAQAEISETEKRIGKVKELALEQAVSLYKGGTTETLDALLSSTSLGELNDRVQMLGIAAEENTGALIKYGRLKVTLEEQYDDLFSIQKELDAKLADREEYQAELEQQKETMVADIAELNDKLDEEKSEEAHKEERYEDIRDEILAAEAAAAATSGAPIATPPGVAPNTGGPSASGFIWPINGAVTSGFGYRWGRMHNGIDIDGYTGQPIVASKSGTVISSGDGGDGYGTKVVISHGGGFTTLYAHMSRLAVSGGSVSQGQVIGYVGCTGSCTGDHLHFEVRVNGTPQNPLSYLP